MSEGQKSPLSEKSKHVDDPSIPTDFDVPTDDHSSPIPTTTTTKKDTINFKCVTWNLWCMPIISPRALSNPDRCANYLYSIAQNQKWNEFNGLIVICLQEVWCWKTGIFPPFLLPIIGLLELIPYIGRFLSAIFQFIPFILGALPLLKCLPIMYDPKSQLINKLKTFAPYSITYSDIPVKKLLDSGLVVMTNIKPYATGFEKYESSTCDDSLANKGFIWCYFDEQNLLITNTHLQAAGSGFERLEQLRQLRRFLTKISKKYEINKILIIGDFNIDMQTHQERMKIYQQQQQQQQKPLLSIHSNNNDYINKINHNKKSNPNPKTVIFDDMEDKPVVIEDVTNTSNINNNNNKHNGDKEHEVVNNNKNDNNNINNNDNSNDNNNNNENRNRKENENENENDNPHLVNFKKYENEVNPQMIEEIHDEVNINTTYKKKRRNKKLMNPDDPLTQISYNILPKQMIPKSVHSILGYKTQYYKKAYINIPYYLGPKFAKINSYQITFKRGKYNIDHIFSDFPVKNVNNESYAQDKNILSDHQLIVSQFTSTNPSEIEAANTNTNPVLI